MSQRQRCLGAGIAVAVLGALLAVAPAATYAAERATDGVAVEVPLRDRPQAPEWGGADQITHIIPAYAMDSWDGTTISNVGYNRYSPSGEELDAPIRLLTGSLIQAIELQGCDTSPSSQIAFTLIRVDSNGNYELLSPVVGTGISATLGCGYYYVDATTPHTVDAYFYTYYVAARTGNTSTTSITAMRVYYQLQVSPAPATATFGDVPTSHPQFRFVEALAASGITGGCGGGNFCPDQALTRGQMAVFLSAALGLHFPY